MNKTIAVGVGFLLLVLLLLFSTTYTVKYNEVAIKATFGQADETSVITEPGLHFRLPVFIDKVTKIDTRVQLVEAPLEEIMTADGLQIVVRAFLLWRVDTEDRGPLEFFKTYTSADNAARALRGQFRTAFTGALSGFRFDDLIGEESRLADAEEQIRSSLVQTLASRGVEPVAVGISQLVLPPKTSSAVLSRMQATRDVLAEAERNIGKSRADAIRNQGKTVAEKIRAFAGQRAAEIRAEGQERAAEYLTQMAEDEELAIFLIWLDALERSLNRHTTVILPADFEPFHLLGTTDVTLQNGIPLPARSIPRVSADRAQAAPVTDVDDKITTAEADPSEDGK